jgi:uncharacterized membrane protein
VATRAVLIHGSRQNPLRQCELEEVLLSTVLLLLSIVLGIVPLAGIAWILLVGSITTVDSMFMSLILLTLSGIFFLNAVWELRDRGFLIFRKKN